MLVECFKFFLRKKIYLVQQILVLQQKLKLTIFSMFIDTKTVVLLTNVSNLESIEKRSIVVQIANLLWLV